MIPIAKPILDEDEADAVTMVLKSGLIAQGKKVVEFEDAFAKLIGTRYAIAVNSGTAALHIALLVHGIGEGDEVITTAFTFAASANSILFTGAKPIFADIEEKTFNIDPDDALRKITPKTRAIMPVHLYGQPCNMKNIMKLVEDHSLILIEDACQAHGADYQNRKVGSFGTGCFSFYATKNMTTGEGGMIISDDKDIAEKAKLIRNHGQKERYFHDILGYNYRMTDFAAAIGICQLRKLNQFNNKREENARLLTQGLSEVRGIITPYVSPDVKHVFHQYVIRVTDDFNVSRDELRKRLKEEGIITDIHYPLPLHKQPLYQKLGYIDHLPKSERASKEVLSLPVHPTITKEDIEKIVRTIQSV